MNNKLINRCTDQYDLKDFREGVENIHHTLKSDSEYDAEMIAKVKAVLSEEINVRINKIF